MQGHPDPSSRHHRRADRPAPDATTTSGRSSPAAGRASPTTRRSRRSGRASLLEIRLETGRTHQIRVHMAALRHPCVGDLTYGADPTLAARLGLTRQWLHAVRSASRTPATGDGSSFEPAYPADLAHALDARPSRLSRSPAGSSARGDDGRTADGGVVGPCQHGGDRRRHRGGRPASAGAGRRSSEVGTSSGHRERLVRAPARAHRVLDARRRGPARPTCSPRPPGMGMPALAMTDHGNVFGAYDFYKQATAAGVKPIIGMEAYLTPGHQPLRADPGAVGRRRRGRRLRRRRVHPHDAAGRDHRGHAQPVPAVVAGRAWRATSTSPAPTASCCSQYAKGLIATTGCPSGEVQTWLRIGEYDEARAVGGRVPGHLRRASNFFCELMDHGLDIERGSATTCCGWPSDLDLPLLATNDLHYTYADDADAHEVLLCVQSGKTMADPKRFKFDARDFYLKSAARDARAVGREHARRRCDNTLLIAERCEVDVRRGRATSCRGSRCPRARPRSPGSSRRSSAGCRGGSRAASPTAHREQAEYELGVIRQMGFPGYFLVVADFINWAKDNGIRVGPGRGSGAGSMVAYALRHHRARPARARPDLRAVPQPRAHLDARHRPRLRRAPARRHDPLRHREVRRGAGRADRHLRHDQGEAGGQGRGPGARLPVRAWATGSPRRCRRR